MASTLTSTSEHAPQTLPPAIQDELISIWVDNLVAFFSRTNQQEEENDGALSSLPLALQEQWRNETRAWIQNYYRLSAQQQQQQQQQHESDDTWMDQQVEEIAQQATPRAQTELTETIRNKRTSATTADHNNTAKKPNNIFSLLSAAPPTFFVWANLAESNPSPRDMLTALQKVEYAEDIHYQDWPEIMAVLRPSSLWSNTGNDNNNNNDSLVSLYLQVHIHWFGLFRPIVAAQPRRGLMDEDLMVVDLMDNLFQLGCSSSNSQDVWQTWWYMWMDCWKVWMPTLAQALNKNNQHQVLPLGDAGSQNNDMSHYNGQEEPETTIGNKCFCMVQTLWQHSTRDDDSTNDNDSNSNDNNNEKNPSRYLWTILDPTAQWFAVWISLILAVQQQQQTSTTGNATETSSFLATIWKELAASSLPSSLSSKNINSDRHSNRFVLTVQGIIACRRHYHDFDEILRRSGEGGDQNRILMKWMDVLLVLHTQQYHPNSNNNDSSRQEHLIEFGLAGIEALFWMAQSTSTDPTVMTKLKNNLQQWKLKNQNPMAWARLETCLARYLPTK